MMDRWWPPVFLIGAALLALAWWRYQDLYTRLTQPWAWMILAGAGALCILSALFLMLLRKSAYVRAYADHFLVATPFLRMNVSYRRIRRTSSVSMAALFPPARIHGLRRDTIEPLLRRTAVVIDLNSLPMPKATLRLFLSPFFFKDETPHIVLLVNDWLGFSTELESRRSGVSPDAVTVRRSQSSILSDLSRR